MTGRNPLLLRSLPEFNDGKFDAAKFLHSHKGLRIVHDNINKFYDNILSDNSLSEYYRRQ